MQMPNASAELVPGQGFYATKQEALK